MESLLKTTKKVIHDVQLAQKPKFNRRMRNLTSESIEELPLSVLLTDLEGTEHTLDRELSEIDLEYDKSRESLLITPSPKKSLREPAPLGKGINVLQIENIGNPSKKASTSSETKKVFTRGVCAKKSSIEHKQGNRVTKAETDSTLDVIGKPCGFRITTKQKRSLLKQGDTEEDCFRTKNFAQDTSTSVEPVRNSTSN